VTTVEKHKNCGKRLRP